MELSVIFSRALAGFAAPLVQVETHLANGLPSFHIVGMPETAVRESRERVRSALINSYFQFPDRRITVNLAPADLPKQGGGFDLPIALGILVASGQLARDRIAAHEFLAELALDGSTRAIPGIIPAAREAHSRGRSLVVPSQCAALAARVPGCQVIAAPDLLTLCAHLNGQQTIEPAQASTHDNLSAYPDLDEVIGQASARRALEIAACGGHNLLFFGPPGSGKTLLASRLPGILPPPDLEDALDGLALRNICGLEDEQNWHQRPFRSPHHSASAAALVGGGGRPRPGEISLAHGGVLFLDELPEFSRHTLEMLREPMESGIITLSRARYKYRYPARFQLIAAMNPCPCGYDGDSSQRCRCSPEQIGRYRQRVSGPLLDRIDLHIPVTRIAAQSLLGSSRPAESTATVRFRVVAARNTQMARQNSTNSELPHNQLANTCLLEEADKLFISEAMESMQLSARAVHRSMRVARTIADLAGEKQVSRAHLGEAFAYRNPDLAL